MWGGGGSLVRNLGGIAEVNVVCYIWWHPGCAG